MNDVLWIDAPARQTGLAIIMRPRGDDWLEDELRRLQHQGIQTIVSTLEHWEADGLGLGKEDVTSRQLGLEFISYPLPDRSVPSDRAKFHNLVSSLARRLQAGERIGVHCRGCIGRSTVVAACTLIKMGWAPEQALHAIEVARGCAVPDTEEQREFILDFGTLDDAA